MFTQFLKVKEKSNPMKKNFKIVIMKRMKESLVNFKFDSKFQRNMIENGPNLMLKME